MPPISIKYVVSFTSQDDRHPVSNIVVSNGYQKWLSHPQEKCGQTEAVFQLDHPCVISYIDIGSIWCATIELKVGRSEWPAGREFETLVYTVSLMTPADCLNNRNPNKTQMFSSDLFCPDVAKKEWDRIKVVCRQPYKKLTQFGLSFLRIKSTSFIPMVSAEKHQQGGADSTSVKDIQKHFLGKLDKSKNDSSTVLKSKLLKIAASSDGGAGVENSDALSRTAKLVLAASGNKSKSYNSQVAVPTSEKHRLYSSRVEQNYEQEFVEEVFDFMKTLVIDPKQLDSIKLSDLRHKLEKKKRRKLTKEEKKIFIEGATKYLTSAFREKKLTSPKQQSPANSKNSVTSSTRVDSVVSNQNVATNNTVRSNPTVGMDRPKAKRKLEDDSITPPPSKMTNNNKTSPIQKSMTPPTSKITNKSSLIQKMKSIENIPVKRDMIGDLKKVQQNGPITTCVTSPSTPFQYKGLRGREADIENENTPKMTSCAKPQTPNSTSAKKRTPKANFKMNFDLSSDDDNDLDTYMLATDMTNSGRGRGSSTRGKSGRGRGAKGTGRGRGNKSLSFEPVTPRNTDEPPWLSAKPATPQGSGNGTPAIRANNNGNNTDVTSPPWLLAAENRLQQQQQPTNVDKPTNSIDKNCASRKNFDGSFSAVPSEAQQNGTPSQEEWNNDTQDQSQSQSLLKRSNSQRKQKSDNSQRSAKKNRRKSSVLQIKFSAIDISSDESDDDGGFGGRVSCAKGGVSSAKGGVSSAKGGVSSAKGGVSSVRAGANNEKGGVNSVKGGASSVRGGDNSFGGGANCVTGGASDERGGVVNDCVIPNSMLYTDSIENGHIESMIPCPLCGDDYPASVIEFHAAQCYL